jgi:hypothetical protein
MINVTLVNCINCLKEEVQIADPRYDNKGKIVRQFEDIPLEDRFNGEIDYSDLCLVCEDLCEEIMTIKERKLTAAKVLGLIK